MDDKPVKRVVGGPAIVAAIVVLFVIMPLVYLLALGPIVWLDRRGYVDVGPESFIARVYYPAELAARHCSPFARAMETYISLWEPAAAPPVIAPAYQSPLPPPPASATVASPATTATPIAVTPAEAATPVEAASYSTVEPAAASPP